MRERRREDAGMSLIEVLVSMVVFSIAVGIAFGAVILVVRKSNDAQKSADAVAELRLALAQIDRQVRSGNVLFSPADESTWLTSCTSAGTDAGTCMRIYTQSNGEQKCVQWQLLEDPDSADPANPTFLLRSRSWESDYATGGSITPWGVIARDLHYAAGTTPAPFTLSTADNDPLTPYGDRMLRVHLESLDERRGQPISIESSITGRNTSYGYDAGQCTPPPPG